MPQKTSQACSLIAGNRGLNTISSANDGNLKKERSLGADASKIKELEQEKFLLKEISDSVSAQAEDLVKSKHDLEIKLEQESKKSKELEQENIILEEIVSDGEKIGYKASKKLYSIIALIAVGVSAGFVAYSYYENEILVNTVLPIHQNYPSNYLIQNLQGDTVDTWVAWNIADGRVINIHITNTANAPQSMIDAIKDAILSTKTVTIDDSLTGKGPKGTSSTYFVGWEGAIDNAYSEPTKRYIPQKFDINGAPSGVGDIEIILTNDVNPDGYSGYTKSIVDGNEILKSKITIFKVNRLDSDRLESIIRHEFGHAMGLGHSTATEDLMSPMLPDYPYISGCDVDTLKGLYDGDKNSKVVCQK
ncbi:Peptidase M10A and M12B matrixin and adamalysin (fragment) [Nitrosotalea devaniterrae]|uniref:Peptidase M10A and M12B matrixin and adamalysin n=1 Tax=Nitrosotalea devaniterrae TaxID=1078905 RepID=A0A128A4F2_9ARCH